MKVLDDDNYNGQRVDLIYSQKYGIYILSFVSALVFAYIYRSNQDMISLITWLGVFALYIIARFFISIYYWDSKQSRKFKYPKYEQINFFISIFGGLIWGASSPLFLLDETPHKLLFAISIYSGICAGGLISNSTSLKANIGFTFSLLTTAIISFIFYKYPERYSIITLLSLFNIACIYCAVIINKLVLNNLKLSCKNEQLLEEIKHSNSKQLLIEKQAIQTSNLATIGEMASGMAHEVNNPLAIIKGNLNLLKRHMKTNSNFLTDEYIDKSIGKCLDSINRIVNVIGTLKKMSQMKFDNPIVSISVEEILNDSVGFINEKLKCSSINLIRNLKDEDLIIHCDPTTTSQILLSLISHAFQTCTLRKYSWIRVRTRIVDKNILFEIESLESNTHKQVLNYCDYDSQKSIDKSFDLTLIHSMAKRVGGNIIIDKNDRQSITLVLPISPTILESDKKAA